MKDILDLHTHTIVSGHAYNSLYEMVRSAADKGLTLYGCSDHTPAMPGGPDAMYFVNFKVIPREIYGVKVLMGAELNLLKPDGSVDLKEKMLEKLDYGNIPNFSLISERFRNLPYDPQNEYTVPYAWGTVGIIYNTTMVDEPITSWDAMFDSRYQGEVLMFRNSRDAMATALLKLGYSLNTTDEAELREAFQLLQDAKSRGVYQSFVMDEIFQKLEGANAAVGAYYAGDYISMLENNEDLALVIPEEGSNWFMDAMCVLKDAPHKEEAEVWMNFIASTEANLANMDFIGYASPNEEALAQYPAYYEELYGEPLDPEIYEIMAVPQEILDKCEAYLVLPAETRKLYNDLWTELGI